MVDGFGLDGVVLAAQAPAPGDTTATDGSTAVQPSLTPPFEGSHPDSEKSGRWKPRSRPPDDAAPDGPAYGDDGPWPDGGSSATFLAARLPPSWAAESQLLFEVYGNLWNALQLEGIQVGHDPGAREQWQVPIGHHRVLLCRMDDDGLPVAAAAVRKAPFTPQEARALATVLGSVVAACSDSDAKAAARHEIRNRTTATVKSIARSPGPCAGHPPAGAADEGAASEESAAVELLAEVHADWQPASADESVRIGGRRSGVGRGSDPVTAVARAAAKACRPRCEIAFAGASQLEDVEVSIVMIRHGRHGLRLGYAVRPKGDHSGAAEAVFTAAG